MSYNFKETMNKPERLAPGHRMCAGCGGTIAVRKCPSWCFMKGTKQSIGNATGCLEVSTFTYHTQHGKTATFTMHLKMQGQHSAVLKALTKR